MRHLKLVRQDNKIEAVKVIINDQDHGTYTHEAYQEYTLQMSTGDFHVHKTESVLVDQDDKDLIFVELEFGEVFFRSLADLNPNYRNDEDESEAWDRYCD